MPAKQRGSTVRRGKSWGVRYYDESGGRRFQGGFATKTEARDWLDDKVDEVSALRRGDLPTLRRRDMPTLRELVDEFSTQHVAEASSIAALKYRLRYAVEGPKLDGEAGWSDVKIDRLNPAEIGAWRKALPAGSAFGIHKSLRQVLHYAVRRSCSTRTLRPWFRILSRSGRRSDVRARRDCGRAAAYSACNPVFAALTGLRPCEWIALERGDVDRRAGVVTVRRTVVAGVAKPYGKTDRSLRAVPLPARAAEVLDEHPPRLDTRVLFPGARGRPLALSPFRHRDWSPALRAAGIEHRSLYAMRHTFASFSIAAGVSLFELSRLMGTSPAMIDKTYGHMLPDALDRARSALDAFVWARNGHSEEAADS